MRDALLVVARPRLARPTTKAAYRVENGFAWGPISEVAKIFAGIFICIVPVLAMLAAREAGPACRLVRLVSDAAGAPNNAAYFWLTGGLSSVPRQCADLSRLLRARRRRCQAS